MLQLILGRAGSGKTYRIREQVKHIAEQNTEKVMPVSYTHLDVYKRQIDYYIIFFNYLISNIFIN